MAVAPTIPTVAAGRVLTSVVANTTSPRVSPNLSGLTKNSGDRLIAILIAYQTGTGTNAAFSGWPSGWTEIHDSATSTTMAIGVAEKISDGTETGTLSVTQATTITGHACWILLSIPGAHLTTASEVGSRASDTAAAANPASFNPAGWDSEPTLWIAVAGSGETSTTGSYTGIASAPTNYTNYVDTGISSDVVGGVEGAVAFRQLTAASEDVGTFSVDTSNARNAAVVIAVRPLADTVPGPPRSVTPSLAKTTNAGELLVEWFVPTSDGGATITSYRVRSSSNGGTDWTDHGTAAGASRLIGSLSSIPYIFQAAAINSVGQGAWSSSSSALRPYALFSDGTSSSTGATVTGLTNGLDYQFRVAAVNSNGQGLWSNTAGPYTPTAPGAAPVLKRHNGSTWVAATVKHGSGWPTVSFGNI